ncbi:MAG: flagellar hook-associated protein FlgK [Acidobacteria bacterium]|nr:flagellar hook-associated protein FlgK [Acidobacteriota bacterium]
MPGLTFGLNVGLSGLKAAQNGLNVVGHNIANVNTPGYSRQRVGLSATPNQLFGNLFYGSGATATNVEGIRDRFLELQILQTFSAKSGMDTRYQTVEGISSAFEVSGESSLGSLVQKFFQGFQDLAARPEDVALRRSVVGTAQSMVTGLQDRYTLLAEQRSQANTGVGILTQEINGLLDQIASLNERIGTEVVDGSDNDSRDQRKALTDKLAGLVGIHAFEASDGSYTIMLDSGAAPLLVGKNAFHLSVTPDPLNFNYNQVNVDLGSAATLDVTRQISGGELGGRLDLRDNILAGYMRQLDQLAAGIQSTVNLQHRTGFALDGVTTGLDFFQGGVPNGANGLSPAILPGAFYAGAVNALTVNAAIVSNPSLIAAAGAAGAPGDNTNARALSNLQFTGATVDTNGDGLGDSGPFSTVIASLVSSIGTQASGLQSNASTQERLLSGLQNQRERISGVDLDEEAANLITFQRAYQASARFLSVIDQLTDQLVNQFGR